jgi:hypothetical protein
MLKKTSTFLGPDSGATRQHFALSLPGRFGLTRSGGFLADPADPQFPACDQNFLQQFEYLLRHPFGQVDEAMVLTNVDTADVHTLCGAFSRAETRSRW